MVCNKSDENIVFPKFAENDVFVRNMFLSVFTHVLHDSKKDEKKKIIKNFKTESYRKGERGREREGWRERGNLDSLREGERRKFREFKEGRESEGDILKVIEKKRDS